MENEFERYARELDLEVNKLPTWGQYLKIREDRWKNERETLNAPEIFAGFTTTLKKILEYLKASDIEDYFWHEDIAPLKFKPMSSPYFRLGRFGSYENVPVDKNLDGVIAIGFGEGDDYENDEKPELVLFYINDNFCTDVDLYKSKNWRGAVNEFFDTSKI